MEQAQEKRVSAPTLKTVSVLMSGTLCHFPTLLKLLHDESGQDMIEYALVAALLGLASIASLKTLSGVVLTLYTGIQSGLSTVL